MSSVVNLTTRALAATFLVVMLAPCAPAQRPASDDARRECGRDLRKCDGETAPTLPSTTIEDDSGRPLRMGEFPLPLSQIKKDIGYLQTAADYLSQTASQSLEPDFVAVAKTASEVRKRAARLRGSLALPEQEKRSRKVERMIPSDPARLREALSTLSALISAAVRNPALGGHVLDASRSADARDELDEIVELCERVKTGSEVLGRNGR